MTNAAKRGQYTTEYLIIIGIGIAIIGIFLVYVSLYYMSFSSTAGSKTLNSAASSLISQASYVSSEGSGSETTFSVAFPNINPAQSYFCGDFLKLTSGTLTSIQKSSIALTGLLPTTAGTYDVHETNTNGLAEVALSQTVSYINSSYKLSGGDLFYVLYFYNSTGGIGGNINFNITILSLSGKYITSQVETSSNGYYSGEIALTSTQPEYLIEIFPIGYNVFSSSCFAPLATTFQEKYLSGGTSWSVSFDGQSGSAGIGDEIIIPTNGSGGPFTANATVSGLSCHSSVLASAGQTVTVSNWNCTTNFQESGLASGLEWWTVYNNENASTTSTSVDFYSNAGTYTFEDKSPITQGSCTYTASPESGSLAAGESQTITYGSSCPTTFTESQLPASTSWWVDYDSSNLSSTGTSITFNTPYATNVPYTVGNAYTTGCTFLSDTPTGTATTGSSVSVPFGSDCTTVFTESGLPSSTSWWVDFSYDSGNKSSTSTSITFVTSYAAGVSYSVGDAHTTNCTFTPSPSSGTLTTGDSQAISYSEVCVATTTFTESGLPTSTSWWVDYDSTNKSATVTSLKSNISFTTPPGTNLGYSVGNVYDGCKNIPSPSSGTLSAGTTQSIGYSTSCPFGYLIPVTITNSQSSPTASPFQQLVNVSSSSVPAASNFQNVEFVYQNGTTIPSWLENYTSSHATWWLKLGSIPASSSITVYMGFASTATNLLNAVNDGVAPQISENPSVPSGVVYNVPLMVSNSQNSATSSPFQQLINLSSSIWEGHAGSYMQNIEFFYPNGTIIPSWLEYYNPDYATWWIKLGSMPAYSSAVIYIGFASTSTNLFNGNTIGEAPTLSVSAPPYIQEYVPITVTNSQTSATVSPFEEELNVPSSVYSSYAASNLQNVEFYYPNGTIIRSWLENRTSSNAIWWLKLGSIPASSSITVYMGFASTATNLLSNEYDGEAPQLSPSYAEYDDGFNVFNFYDDFKGTSLNTSKWTYSGTVSVNNGVTLGAGGTSGSINTISTSVVPSDMDLMGITYGTFNATTSSYSSMNYGLNGHASAYITDLQGINAYYFTYYSSSSPSYGSPVGYSGTHTGLYTFNASNDDHLTMDLLGNGVATVTSSAISPYGNFSARTGIGPEIINYIAIASLPPNGVMPSASFGSATAVSSTYGEYDNGAKIFDYYYSGASDSGWATAGTTGQTTSAPVGSPFGTNALYADGGSGDYMYTSLPSFSSTGNYIIQYYVNVGKIGDFFFTTNSAGTGTMTRLDGRGGADYVGLAKTSSWTSWDAPSTSTLASENTWYLQSTVIAGSGTEVGDYLSTSLNNINNLGNVVNTLATTYSDSGGTETYSEAGNYIGLIGDSAGGTSYWNGIIIRAYPPNGVMPSVTVGSAYGQYDDGANVFNFYSNFAGTTLNTNQWTTPTIPYSVDNGLTLDVPSSSGAYGSIDTVPTFSAGSVFDFYGEPTTNNGGSGFDLGVGDCINCNPPGDSWMLGASSGLSGYYLYLDASTALTNYARSYGVWTVGLEPNGETAFSEYNYGDEYTVTDSSFNPTPNNYLILIHNGDLGNTFVQWFLERTAPPNGVMPSVSFGSGFAPYV